MIQVIVSRVSHERIKKIEVSGHAMTGDPGTDLVCAGVSSIMIGALNGFDTLDNDCNCVMNNQPYISIECTEANQKNQLLFHFLLIQLKTVEISYGEAIEIIEKEEIR